MAIPMSSPSITMIDENKEPARIMVVDDDPDVVAVFARYLQREGFVAFEAFSGTQCLELVLEKNIDLILLDLMMPDMDGFQVVTALKSRRDTADIPVIMISARDD